MSNKKPKSKYIPFIERLDTFIILIYFGLLCLAGIFLSMSSYEIVINNGKVITSMYVILFIGCCCLLLSLYSIIKTFRLAIIFINEVEINSRTITLKGYKYNEKWEETLNIKNIDICIKEQINRRPYIYHLELLDEDDTKYNINTSKYWSYDELLNLHNEIKKAKEKNINT